ncbi:class I SAM-dependent methyltransferase [Phnomibacter sp. MR]|uniref:class I SAM-dependent methyltransferase n=1 Tax=Phnomibacter sp. MR TaxID=3042318 RepID=UPI003A7FC2EC
MLIERANAGLHHSIWEQLVAPLLPLSSVMDIGCGSGAWLSRFQQAGTPQLLGLDLDTAQFQLQQVPTIAMNFDHYRNEVFGSFQLITCLELIEHLENPGHVISMIQHNLAQDGCCIMSTPNIHSRNARLRYALKGELGHFDTKSDPTHIYPVYTDNLKKLLQRRGLRIDSIHRFPEGRSLNYNAPIRLLAGLLRPFMKSTYEGDNIIYIIRHQ